MSAMNDLDLQLKEREEFYHRMAEEAVEGLKTIPDRSSTIIWLQQ